MKKPPPSGVRTSGVFDTCDRRQHPSYPMHLRPMRQTPVSNRVYYCDIPFLLSPAGVSHRSKSAFSIKRRTAAFARRVGETVACCRCRVAGRLQRKLYYAQRMEIGRRRNCPRFTLGQRGRGREGAKGSGGDALNAQGT